MKTKDFSRTNKKVILKKGYSIADWIASKYYERFGTDELIQLINDGKKSEAQALWDKEVRSPDVVTLKQSEFKKWFFELDKKKPKEASLSTFANTMIQVAYILGPAVIEDTDEFLAKPLFTDESTK